MISFSVSQVVVLLLSFVVVVTLSRDCESILKNFDLLLKSLVNLDHSCSNYLFLIEKSEMVQTYDTYAGCELSWHTKWDILSEQIIRSSSLYSTSLILHSPVSEFQLNDSTTDFLIKTSHPLILNSYEAKCSFALLQSIEITRSVANAIKSSKWFRSCSEATPCYHFTVCFGNCSIQNLQQRSFILESVQTEQVLLKERNRTHHYIIIYSNTTNIIYVCSSRFSQFITTTQSGTNKCSKIPNQRLRVVRHALQGVDMSLTFHLMKNKRREIFTKVPTLMIGFQMQLAIKLNTSVDFPLTWDTSSSFDKLHNNEADLCGETSFTPSLARRVGYSSHATMIDKVGFYTSKPRPLQIKMDFIVQPFKLSLWIGIIGSVICLSFVSYYGSNLFHNKNAFSWSTNLRLFLLPLMEQSQQDFQNSATFGRGRMSWMKVLVGMWLLSAIIFGTMYKGLLVSLLVNPALSYPPSTFEELLNHKPSYELYNDGYWNLSPLSLDLIASGTEIATNLQRRLVNQRPPGHELISVCMKI